MYINKIKILNFKSFRGEHEINFEDLKGCWWMTGRIGSGKTTIGESIIFGLFGSVGGKNNKDLIAWGEKHSVVEVWCRARNNSIYIRRENNSYGQNPLYVEVNGEPVNFTSKRDAQQQLEQEYLDATRTTMELLCIISFNNFKSLSTLNAKDTKQFLDYVLGLEVLTHYVELCKEEQSTLNKELNRLSGERSVTETQIYRMENQTFIEGDIEQEQQCIKEIDSKISLIKEQKTPIITDLQTKLNKKQTRLTEVKTLGVSKKKEIEFIKQGVCPTCGAPIDQSQLEIKEQERKNLLEQYTELTNEISQINAILRAENDEMTNYISQLSNSRISHEKTVIKLQEQSKQHRANNKEIERLKNEVDKIDKKETSIQSDIVDYDVLIGYLGQDVREKMMSAFIPSINTKITEIASSLRMPYVPSFDLSFKCSVQNGSGNLIPTSSLSTGQLKLVDTVIILAILSSIINKVHSNVIFLDELFSNLDYNTRTDLLIILRTILPADSSIIIVSHQDMETELIDGHIKMELEHNQGVLGTSMKIEKKSYCVI